jgi:hypothetical protein
MNVHVVYNGVLNAPALFEAEVVVPPVTIELRIGHRVGPLLFLVRARIADIDVGLKSFECLNEALDSIRLTVALIVEMVAELVTVDHFR